MSTDAAHNLATRVIHLGLVVFGITAFVASDWAGQYKDAEHLGFTVHMWLGAATTLFVVARLVYGFVGPTSARFATWVPYTRARFDAVTEDIKGFTRFKLPERESHQGVAGFIQAIGLATFAIMGLTGMTMFFFLDTGQKASGWISGVKEIHEAFGGLVGAYLFLHIGAVILHALMGQPVWKRMFSR